MRVPTLQTSRQQLSTITDRQAEQARLQQQISSGVRIRTPGEDPAAAAAAELARSRMARLAQDQRATGLASTTLGAADDALRSGQDLLQSAREALVSAGNSAYSDADRQALAVQLRSVRSQLLGLANTADGAGGYVFGGQGTDAPPLSGTTNPVFAAASGQQRIGQDGSYQASLDGPGLFMAVPSGNGVFETASASGNTGTGWIGAGSVSDATRLTGHSYSITIGGTAGAQTWTAIDTSTGQPVASAQPFSPGSDLEVDGQRVRISGAPAAGDSFSIAPAGRQSVFATLDQAIALLGTPGGPTKAGYKEGMERALTGLDRVMDGFDLARTQVGESLKAVDTAASSNDAASLAQSTRKSALVDTDLAAAISAFQSNQSGTEAALKVYASVKRNSLFELMG